MATSLMPPRSASMDGLFLDGLPNLQGALCKGSDEPDLWFGSHTCDEVCDRLGCQGKSETGRVARIKAAKAMCDRCPAKVSCANWAIDNKVAFGIWGGLNERQRTRMRLDGKRVTTYE